ncbi:MAG: glycine oxidase ThiO [Actinomycetota bacterium]
MSAPDVVVVGGGAIGASVAWRCAARGIAVTLIEETPGRGSTWAAAGMLAPVTEAHFGEERLLELNIDSSRRWSAFAAELEELTGASIGYEQCGTVMVAPDADGFAVISELLDYQERLDLKVERLSRTELRALEPALAPGIRGGALVEGDHHVDNRALVDALLDACRLTGVELHAGSVASITTRGDRVVGVELDGGESRPCEQVVVAAGCWSGGIEGVPDEIRSAVRPVKGQLLYLRGPVGAPPITRNVRSPDIYIVPRGDGRIVVGATVEEMGWDVTVTADAVYTLLRDAFAVVPALDAFELIECVAGLRPGSRDNAPIIGPGGPRGLVVATGHYRNGILLTPVTADSVAEIVATGGVPDAIREFTPSRLVVGDAQ